jgi:hypothetical protein
MQLYKEHSNSKRPCSFLDRKDPSRGKPLDFEVVDGYARIALPPVGTHAVIIVE